MQSKAETVDQYMADLPEDRKSAMTRLRKEIKKNLPKGFKEEMSYGMIGYVVPHTLYPDGYHCNPKLPLPFMNLASQKNFIALYHMGVYADPKLRKWYETEYKKQVAEKVDMGKGCLRFKKPADIPFKFLGELVTKMTPAEWINIYETKYKPSKKKK